MKISRTTKETKNNIKREFSISFSWLIIFDDFFFFVNGNTADPLFPFPIYRLAQSASGSGIYYIQYNIFSQVQYLLANAKAAPPTPVPLQLPSGLKNLFQVGDQVPKRLFGTGRSLDKLLCGYIVHCHFFCDILSLCFG